MGFDPNDKVNCKLCPIVDHCFKHEPDENAHWTVCPLVKLISNGGL